MFFLFFLFFSVNAYGLEYSGLTNHILMNNIKNWSFPLQISLLLACLTFLSTFILVATSFTRIIIVLSLLRNALGIPSLPPNQILISMSLLLTFFIMNPTIHRIYEESYLPLCDNNIKFDTALVNGIKPIYDFMRHQTYYSDISMFSKLAHTRYVSTTDVVSMKVLLPSFITSELKTAFRIGFTIFLPFLIIDIIVASILMSLGMLMVSPSSISLPIKLILFVLVDGWQLLFSSLVKSFY
ncbi:Flagellar biosynthetic protein FliP [Buchnera aphidicola (Panaphis juglandis)]